MIELRPYQIQASEWLVARKRGWVVAPAGSGKTIIAAAAIGNWRGNGRLHCQIGWIANTREQVEQAVTAFKEYHLEDAVRVECAAAQTDWSDRDLLIVDEFHHSAAPTWRQQIETCQDARWGLTATPGSNRERLDLFTQLFGERYDIDRSLVSDNLAPAIVVWLDASDVDAGARMDASIKRQLAQRERWWKGEHWQLEAQCKWRAAIDEGIVANEARNQAVMEMVYKHMHQSILVLVNEVEHGKILASRLPGALAAHASMGVKKRREALDAFRSGACKCLIATSLADEGLDLPMIEVLILVSGGRSMAKTEQRTGRALRQFAGKERALIYDFKDSFHPFMANQSKERSKLYQKLRYYGV